MKTVEVSHLQKLPHRFQVAFALFCAKQVAHLSKDERVAKAIATVERWLAGEATQDECRAAASYAAFASAAAAYAADAAASAARASAYAAHAAAYAAAYASASERASLIKAQWDYYNELLDFDEGFERVTGLV